MQAAVSLKVTLDELLGRQDTICSSNLPLAHGWIENGANTKFSIFGQCSLVTYSANGPTKIYDLRGLSWIVPKFPSSAGSGPRTKCNSSKVNSEWDFRVESDRQSVPHRRLFNFPFITFLFPHRNFHP